ncbi:ABC transporter permease [Virgibacillus halodenitrificans]|uniref:ABC transporter permease n=1 Tax=Virgibacillus halodenitrificans TaxID=1482 RepID=UPI00045CE83C|nr:ABC transporter permease [Virgibacillus halodenitrificans]CDQ32650.1 Inner membrane transport permease YbhR [Virgibacillus halodenitrificans]
MRINALVIRIIRQMRRDKRTLALLFLAPLLVLSLMYLIFDSSETEPTITITGGSTQLTEQLEQADFNVTSVEQFSTEEMKEKNEHAWLNVDKQKMELTLLNDDPSQAKKIQMQLGNMLSTEKNGPGISANYVYGDKDTKIFDTFSPMLIGFFVFFFVFLIAGISLLKERTSGTLERLMATPIKRYEIIAGYLVGFGIFAFIQTIIIVFYSIYVLDIVHIGSIWLVILTNILIALVALSLGTLLSSFAASEFQMMQFIPLVIVPQIFFTGIFPMEGMAGWLQSLGKIMPLFYASDALKGVMYNGFSFQDIAVDLLILLIFAALFIVLNIVALRKYRSF